MAASRTPALEPAAGLALESKPQRQALAKGEYSVASRALGLATYFLSGALAINISQLLGSPLKAINEDWYNAWIAFTKQSFGLLTMTLTQTFAPTKVIVSGDESVRGQLLKSTDGNLILDFPERLVLIANHQIYTDWLYLWWIAYCNGMHGRLYIILKESLRKIPVLGWGMQLSQFIFLKRNWEEDKPNMAKSLQKLNKPTDPMWLLLFPEGTNLAPSTRERSAAWAKKNNISDCRHTLLPRSTGLHFCLDELKGTVEYLYDITVVYEGVPRGQYAQDIFTLQAAYGEGRPPKSVNMHFRRFAVKDIPLHDDKAFELWLRARWREKDIMIEEYYQTGKLPGDYGGTRYKSGKVLRGCGHMEVPIRASHWYEFLQIFAPMGILAMILYIFYGDLPQKFWKSINKQALHSGTQDIRQAGAQAGKNVKSAGSALGGMTLDDLFEPGKQEETFKAGAMAVQKLITSPQAQTLLNRADFMQAFLSDPQKLVEDTITDKQQNFIQQLAQEEAKRKQASVTPSAGVGFVKPASSRTTSSSASAPISTKKGNFYNQLNAEEKSRRGSVISAPATKKATFWDSLNAEKQSRQVSSGSSKPPSQQPKGTFYQDLKAAESKKNTPPLTNKNLAAKGNFWDAVKKEESNRLGTVVTLSSGSSTKVGTQSLGTGLKGKSKAASVAAGGPPKSSPSTRPPMSVAKKPPPSTRAIGSAAKSMNATKAVQNLTSTTTPAKKTNIAPLTKKVSAPTTQSGGTKPAPSLAGNIKSKPNTTRPVVAGPSKTTQTATKTTAINKQPALPKPAPSPTAKATPTPLPSKPSNTVLKPAPKPLATKNTNTKLSPVRKNAQPSALGTKSSPSQKARTAAKPTQQVSLPSTAAAAAAKKPAPKPAAAKAPPKLNPNAAGNSIGPAKKKPPALNAKGPPKLKT